MAEISGASLRSAPCAAPCDRPAKQRGHPSTPQAGMPLCKQHYMRSLRNGTLGGPIRSRRGGMLAQPIKKRCMCCRKPFLANKKTQLYCSPCNVESRNKETIAKGRRMTVRGERGRKDVLEWAKSLRAVGYEGGRKYPGGNLRPGEFVTWVVKRGEREEWLYNIRWEEPDDG